jgi:hypothetical protein
VPTTEPTTATFAEFAQRTDYSLLEFLQADPQATGDGHDHRPRQVFSGHYVPVTPTPLSAPELVAHSSILFEELGLSEALVHDEQFLRLFSGDISVANESMRPYGWATGYALSIYGSEYIQQCPFGKRRKCGGGHWCRPCGRICCRRGCGPCCRHGCRHGYRQGCGHGCRPWSGGC